MFNKSLQIDEYTSRTIIALKSSRCSDPIELIVIYNHTINMVEENMVKIMYLCIFLIDKLLKSLDMNFR